MTRKDYIQFAQVLKDTRPSESREDAMLIWRDIRAQLTLVLRRDNPQFDGARFFAATEK